MKAEIRFYSRVTGDDGLQAVRQLDEGAAEILFVKKGEGTLVLGDRILPIQANSLYFIAPGMLHCTTPVRSEEYERSVIVLSRGVLADLLPLAAYDALFLRLVDLGAVALNEEGVSQMERLLPFLEGDKLRQKVSALFWLLELADRHGDRLSASVGKVATIAAYIKEHLFEAISLEGMSEALFISKYYLCHLFKATTGISITAYILLQRVSFAKRLLATTALPISEIARSAGFSDVTYFSRVFRKSAGIPASEYRRKSKE